LGRPYFPRGVGPGEAWAEEAGGGGDLIVGALQRPYRTEPKRRCSPIEQRHVQPLRLERRPPAQPGSLGVALVECERLRLCDLPLPSCDTGRPKPFPAQHHRVVEIDELGVVGELELRERQRQPTPAQQGWGEPLAGEARELLDDARQRLLGEIEAAVRPRIVVTALALVRPRKPEGAVRSIRRGALVPRQAPVEDHANESERSARIARISSSVRPSRIRSIGRRSPSTGLSPKSQASAASRS